MDYSKLIHYVRPKRCLDIGAHIGNFSEVILKASPECELVAIEANPNCEPYLNKKKLRYEMIALGATPGMADFYIETENEIGTGASLYKENTEWYEGDKSKTLQVTVDTLDNRSYFKDEIIDLVKMDVQGAELDILNGGRSTIMRSKYVLLEVSLIKYNQGAPLMPAVVEKMKEYGFYIEDILDYQKLPNQVIFQLDILFKNYCIY